MRARYTWGLSLAAALMAVNLSAQTSSGTSQATTPDDSRTPSTTQPATSGDESTTQGAATGAETTARTEQESAGTVTIVGCVQKERDVLGTRGMGVGDEYVLTNVGKDAEGAHSTHHDATASAAGESMPAGHAAQGGVYTLTGDGEDDLESMVGKRVEIVGRLEHAGDSTAASGASASTATGAAADDQPASASGAEQPVGTSGTEVRETQGDEAEADDAQVSNTGSTLAEDPAYEGSRSPDAREGIEARRRAESLPRVEISSVREVEGDCEAPAQR